VKGQRLLRTEDKGEEGKQWLRAAVEQQNQVLRSRPDNVFAHISRGRSLKSLGETTEAIAALVAAVACNPEESLAHYFLGLTLCETGDLAHGLDHLEKAVEFAPDEDRRPKEALAIWREKADKKNGKGGTRP
jgi:tetratricopeptide (TPR) repeat protein